MAPFQSPYARSSSRLGELFRAQREAQAETTRRQGDIAAQTWGNVGNTISNTLSSLVKLQQDAPIRTQQAEMGQLQLDAARGEAASQQRAAQEEAALRKLFEGPEPPPPAAIISAVGPERGQKIVAGLAALHTENQKAYASTQGLVRDVLLGMDALPEGLRAEAYPAVRQNLITRGVITEQDAPETYSPEWFAQARNFGKEATKPKFGTRDPKLDIINQGTGEIVTAGTPEPKATPNPTEASLASAAANGDPKAKEALRLLRAQNVTPQGPQPGWQWVIRGNKPVYTNRVQEGDTPQNVRVKPTEDERKTAGYYVQMKDAISTIDALEGSIDQKELYQIQTLPQEKLIGLVNRNALSENAKRYLRAFEQFTEARLRPVSGAAIADTEYARDRRTYAKQFGETPKLGSDRQRARNLALDALKKRAGASLDDTETTPSGAPEASGWTDAGGGFRVREKR